MTQMLSIGASYEALAELEPFLRGLLAGMEEQALSEIVLAVHELGLNIVRHGYAGADGKIEINASRVGSQFHLMIRDWAQNRYYPPEQVAMPDPLSLPEHGWGVYILHKVMDKVEYAPQEQGNIWRLEKNLPPELAKPSEKKSPPLLLVVDDESITRRLVAYTLKPLGVEVLGAEDGQSALEQARSNPIQMILVDINLPGMDGFTLIQRLRELAHLKEVPLLTFTGRNHPDDERRAKEVGASGFLYKPFSTAELRSLVSEHLHLTN